MRRRNSLMLVLAGLSLFLGQTPEALAQYYTREPSDPYLYDRGRQGDYYAEPDLYSGEFDRPTRALPRRGLAPEERDYGAYGPERDLEPPPPSRAQRRPGARMAALPPDADPAYSTPLDFDAQVDPGVSTKNLVDDPTGQTPNTITIDTKARKLYLSVGRGQAIEYGVGVGREGFAWKGAAQIGRKAYWPGWTPPKEMLLRRPDLPDHMEGGLENPLGARALYLFKGAKDTLFRIHGTNEPDTIGKAVSSGCIRMLNADVIDLYGRVSKGTRVVVL
ncbi:L,D-transpeptidase [Methylocystis iwaonis]|uniref:L,D-transpeptidase n=1 Tax=Methylocystis iwaonis TaxID=2885079 RepID=UPI002E7B82C2|nr:L,D-transpeptidase [Methylocystis iwaonis]